MTRTGMAQVVTSSTATPSIILFNPSSKAESFSVATSPTASIASSTLFFALLRNCEVYNEIRNKEIAKKVHTNELF